MNLEKRYQVFVSSTFQDLHEERQEVIQALLELDCIPIGMELFPAANEDQWTLIKHVIADCDYYLVIVAGRYGSVASDGMSYTEKEYRYAAEINKPIMAFLHDNPVSNEYDVEIESGDYRKIMVQFRALGLIRPSEERRSVKDRGDHLLVLDGVRRRLHESATGNSEGS